MILQASKAVLVTECLCYGATKIVILVLVIIITSIIVHSFILQTYIAPLQRRSQPSHY